LDKPSLLWKRCGFLFLPSENQYWVCNFHDFENTHDNVHIVDM
jgi:hypothetical protein